MVAHWTLRTFTRLLQRPPLRVFHAPTASFTAGIRNEMSAESPDRSSTMKKDDWGLTETEDEQPDICELIKAGRAGTTGRKAAAENVKPVKTKTTSKASLKSTGGKEEKVVRGRGRKPKESSENTKKAAPRKPTKKAAPLETTSKYFEALPQKKPVGRPRKKKASEPTALAKEDDIIVLDDETPSPSRAAPRKRDWTPVRNIAPLGLTEATNGATTPVTGASEGSVSSGEKRKVEFKEQLDYLRLNNTEPLRFPEHNQRLENVKLKKRCLGSVKVSAPKKKAPKKPARKPKKAAISMTGLAQAGHAQKDVPSGPLLVPRPDEAKAMIRDQSWEFGTSSQLANGTVYNVGEEGVVKQGTPQERSLWDEGMSDLTQPVSSSQFFVHAEDEVAEANTTVVINIPSSPAASERRMSWTGTSVSSPEKVANSPLLDPLRSHSPSHDGYGNDFYEPLPPPEPLSPFDSPIASGGENNSSTVGSDLEALTQSAFPGTKFTDTDTSLRYSRKLSSPQKKASLFVISDDEDDIPTSYQPPSQPILSPRISSLLQSPEPCSPTGLADKIDEEMTLSPTQSPKTGSFVSYNPPQNSSSRGRFDSTDDESDPPLPTTRISRQSTNLTILTEPLDNTPSSPSSYRLFSTTSVTTARSKVEVTKSDIRTTKKTSSTAEKKTVSKKNTTASSLRMPSEGGSEVEEPEEERVSTKTTTKTTTRKRTTKPKPADIAPEPGTTDYSGLTSAELVKLVDSFGLRPAKSRKGNLAILAKSQAIQAASCNDPIASAPILEPTSTEYASGRARSRSASASPIRASRSPSVALDDEFCGYTPEMLQKKLSAAIRDSEFWEKILQYEPLVLQDVHNWVNREKVLGMVVPHTAIKTWADATGVCFVEADSGWAKVRARKAK